MSELVLNAAHWSDTGLPVQESIAMENPGGFVTNVECSDEPPLRLPRCACRNAGAAAEGNVPPRRDPNYGNNDPATGYGVGTASIFGTTPRAGEDSNADTYGDAAEMELRRGQLRADLGLTTEENPERARSKTRQAVENLRPVPGFPLKSRLAE